MADHEGLCCNPVDCDCWSAAAEFQRLKGLLVTHEQLTLELARRRLSSDRTRDDLLRHEGNLERRTDMKDLT
jgi:hypothetical protein